MEKNKKKHHEWLDSQPGAVMCCKSIMRWLAGLTWQKWAPRPLAWFTFDDSLAWMTSAWTSLRITHYFGCFLSLRLHAASLNDFLQCKHFWTTVVFLSHFLSQFQRIINFWCEPYGILFFMRNTYWPSGNVSSTTCILCRFTLIADRLGSFWW